MLSDECYCNGYILGISLKIRVSALLSAVITLNIVIISMATLSHKYNLIEGAAMVKQRRSWWCRHSDDLGSSDDDDLSNMKKRIDVLVLEWLD